MKAKEKKARIIHYRATSREEAQIKREAQRLGLSLSDLIRTSVKHFLETKAKRDQ